MNERILKVNELIRQQLGQIIREEIEFPQGVLVTITRVITARDLRQAKVYISVLPIEKQEQAIKILISEVNNLHHLLNEKVTLRNTPKPKFFIDNSEENAKDIDDLLDNLDY